MAPRRGCRRGGAGRQAAALCPGPAGSGWPLRTRGGRRRSGAGGRSIPPSPPHPPPRPRVSMARARRLALPPPGHAAPRAPRHNGGKWGGGGVQGMPGRRRTGAWGEQRPRSARSGRAVKGPGGPTAVLRQKIANSRPGCGFSPTSFCRATTF